MALTDEALAHAQILVGFVAAFCKSDACKVIHQVEFEHEVVQSPNSALLEKAVVERNDLSHPVLRVIDKGVPQEE